MLEAPVCFGSITYHSVDAEKCEQCSSFDGCAQQVRQHIAEVSRVLDVSSVLAKHKALAEKGRAQKVQKDSGKLKTQRPPIERDTTVATASITSVDEVTIKDEAKTFLVASLKLGTIGELKNSLKAGINPYPESMPFEHAVAQLLINGPTTVAKIREAAGLHADGSEVKTQAMIVGLTGSTIATKTNDGSISLGAA